MLELRPYQVDAVQSIYDYYEKNSGNCIVAMPTGTGKSLVIADFVCGVMGRWPGQRILMLTHVAELVEQNMQELLTLWPTAPLGVYSAGLGRREVAPITFASVQTVWKRAAELGPFDLVLVDECHLIGTRDESMYGTFLTAMRGLNPRLKVIGLSATPYRLGQGMLTDGGLFTDVCFDNTQREEFNKLLAAGYLMPLVPKRTQTQIDVSAVHVRGGEYVLNELQQAVDKEQITYLALKEMVEQGADRHAWLIFTTGVEHTEHVTEMLAGEFGIPCASVHSKTERDARNRAIRQFKRGELRCLVNNNILTTGFNAPRVDMIGVLRHTQSPGLWVQMLGRGTRPSHDTGKRDCLVLDFADNTRRLGPINDPVIPRKKGMKGGTAPIKLCEQCGTYNHASVLHCVSCGFEFHRDVKFHQHASTTALIAGNVEPPQIEEFVVDRVTYAVHRKMDKPDSMKVSYYCGLRLFREWVCVEHGGFAANKARSWWRQRFDYTGAPQDYQRWTPDTTAEAVDYASMLRVPRTIRVWLNRKTPEIMGYEF